MGFFSKSFLIFCFFLNHLKTIHFSYRSSVKYKFYLKSNDTQPKGQIIRFERASLEFL